MDEMKIRKVGFIKRPTFLADWYVLIKTKNDEEILHCSSLSSAEHCVQMLKKYNFADTEISILQRKEEE